MTEKMKYSIWLYIILFGIFCVFDHKLFKFLLVSFHPSREHVCCWCIQCMYKLYIAYIVGPDGQCERAWIFLTYDRSVCNRIGSIGVPCVRNRRAASAAVASSSVAAAAVAGGAAAAACMNGADLNESGGAWEGLAMISRWQTISWEPSLPILAPPSIRMHRHHRSGPTDRPTNDRVKVSSPSVHSSVFFPDSVFVRSFLPSSGAFCEGISNTPRSTRSHQQVTEMFARRM